MGAIISANLTACLRERYAVNYWQMPSKTLEYLTVRELAELLRIKERKVYAMVATGEIPCSRAMGKLLFPRRDIEAWVASHSTGRPLSRSEAGQPAVFVGSHDPLLEWALRESRCGIASFFDGSLDGLKRLKAGEAIAAGLHLYDAAEGEWNHAHVAREFADAPVALLEWAWRERGLIVPAKNPKKLRRLSDLKALRVILRQPEAGGQVLFEALLEKEGIPMAALKSAMPPARSEADVAVAVSDGKADGGFGLAAIAGQFRLGFVPLLRERYDLLVFRRAYFEEPFQRFLDFCRTAAFVAKAKGLCGYDISGFGKVRYLGS